MEDWQSWQSVHYRGSETLESQPASLAFEVATPAAWMVLRFDYGKPRTWRQLVVRDPAGRVRFMHLDVMETRVVLLHRDPYVTSMAAAAGTISSGVWTIQFLRNAPESFVLSWISGDGPVPDLAAAGLTPSHDEEREVWCDGNEEDAGPELTLNRYDWFQCRGSGRRWYKGDLHGHTTLSDGQMTPSEMTRQAEARGLDYYVVTEHNVMPGSWPKGRPLVLPGMEFTSFGKGDWNAVGLRTWIDSWGTGRADRGMETQAGQNRLMAEAAAAGALRTLNHPLAGRFAWRYPDTPLELIDLFEIWNSPSRARADYLTERTLTLWSLLWNEGYRIPGVGGSDTHQKPEYRYEADGSSDTIGDPASYVLLDRLTPEELLLGLRAGHVYVSRGPMLDVTVQVGSKSFTFGDDLTEALAASPDGYVHMELIVQQARDSQLCLIENGVQIDSWEIGSDLRRQAFSFNWTPGDYNWRRYEIRDTVGKLLCFTNPISAGRKKSTIRTWGQLLELAGFVIE
ncbi:CehA/McbA family metallohydrolase [Paenibacillus sp. HJGM_3]|uniref:CehA/McbA family metallohydrolase n=1 Tax=Paenibacillus sp. HJGM_3 TaxID=3379816 RepID=UPI0038581C7F